MQASFEKDNGWKTDLAGIFMILAAILVGLTFTVVIVAVEQARKPVAAEVVQAPPPLDQAAPAPAAAAAPAAPAAAAVPTAGQAQSPTAAPVSAAAPAAAPAAQAAAAPAANASKPSPPSAPVAVAAAAAPAGDATAGSAVFATLCTGCHPGGNAGVGPALHGVSDDTVMSTVRGGSGIMPPFSASQVSDKQMADIVAFLHTLK